jgi:hypothetical protein
MIDSRASSEKELDEPETFCAQRMTQKPAKGASIGQIWDKWDPKTNHDGKETIK